MKRYLLLMVLTLLANLGFAQDEAAKAEAAEEKTWKTGIGLGLDFAQLLQINPKVGAGEDRIGFGGAVNYFANMKQGRHAWDNAISWRIYLQRLGSGVYTGSGSNGETQIPFQKSIDELRLDSKYGYAITKDKKWYMATELSLLTQMLRTYEGNLLTDAFNPGAHEISKFFAPAILTYSVGVDYKPNDNWSFYYSPIALKTIIVSDDAIAAMPAVDADGNFTGSSIHGTPWRSATDYDNALVNFGSLLKVQFQKKFLPYGKDQHRILFKSFATFHYDYLQGQKRNDNPDYVYHVDVDWGTETNVVIFKGLTATLTTNLFYDWDVPVQETDWDSDNGVSGKLVRRASFVQQLLIKYTHNF